MDACDPGTLNFKVFWFLEVFSFCAVDGFAIISGYMAADRPRAYHKLVEMWFQAFFYSFILTLILTAAGVNVTDGKTEILKCALPVTYNKFWYFTAFFALFLAIPMINRFIFSIDEELSKKVFLILFILFSVMGLAGDPFKTLGGYSAIWLIVLYCMGALAKRIKLFETKKTSTLIVLWALCIIVTWGRQAFLDGYRLINYISPTILVSGMIMVVLFSRLELKGTMIKRISPLVFGIYLFQLNQVIWRDIIKDAFVFAAQTDLASGVFYVFLFALILFIAGMIMEYVRTKIFCFIRIPLISRKVVRILELCLEKCAVFLE